MRRSLVEVAAGSWIAAGPAEFVTWAKFAALYRAHIAAEEANAFPAARAALDDATLQAIGRDMAERRGLA